MPSFMPMILTNGHPPQQQTKNAFEQSLATIPRTFVGDSLNRSMIARIHMSKPGCKSCGR